MRERFRAATWAWALTAVSTGAVIGLTLVIALLDRGILLGISIMATLLVILTSALAMSAVEKYRDALSVAERYNKNETGLARHVAAHTAVIRRTTKQARELTAKISMLDEETAALLSLLDDVSTRAGDVGVAVEANAQDMPAPDGTVHVSRAIDRVVTQLGITAKLETTQILARGSRRHLECALRLTFSAMNLDTDDRVLVRVQRLNDSVSLTIATDGNGPTPEALEGLDEDPRVAFGADDTAQALSVARGILKKMGSDVAFVQALGWSTLVLTLEAADLAKAEEEPPILSLTLPLDASPSPSYGDLSSRSVK